MILVVSGEGPTDIGRCESVAEVCPHGDFVHGPMAALIDQLVTLIWGFSPLGTSAMVFVSEHSLGLRSRALKPERKARTLVGLKRGQNTGYFFNNARALAQIAKELAAEAPQIKVGAVLFRDADGTNSAGMALRSDKVMSMERGFEAENFELGVPMVAQPKSEAWLMCALQQHPYTNCERFESLPGNDASPNSAKKQLDEALTARGKAVGDLVDMAEAGTISATRISMPSFDEFRQRLEEVAKAMM